METGEEISYKYVADSLRVAVEQWNHAVAAVHEKSSDPAFLLKALEAGHGREHSEQAIDVALQRIQDALSHLKPVCLKDSGLLHLG